MAKKKKLPFKLPLTFEEVPSEEFFVIFDDQKKFVADVSYFDGMMSKAKAKKIAKLIVSVLNKLK